MVAAAFCGNPQFLVGRVAVDDDLRAVRRFDGQDVSGKLAVEIPAVFRRFGLRCVRIILRSCG